MRLAALAAVTAVTIGIGFSADAAPLTLTGVIPGTNTPNSVSFDTNGAPTKVEWAQGGVFSGLPENRRAPCDTLGSGVRADGTQCIEPLLAGYNLDPNTNGAIDVDDVPVELSLSNVAQEPQDVLAAFFANPLINGSGIDLLIFESLNSSDSPALRITVGGVDILGTALSVIEITEGNDDDTFTIWGFDFALLGLAPGAIVSNPIFITTSSVGDGSADIAGIVGLNVVPVPAALPLFLSGIAGLGWAFRRKRVA